MTIEIIRGDWMLDGYISDMDPRRAQIVLVDGRAYYDTEGRQAVPLRLTADDEITDAAPGFDMGRVFSPDPGEIERIGRHHFGSK